MKKLDRYLSIFALVVVAGTPLLNKPVTATEAALTAPASYDYAYKYDSTYGGYLAFGDSTDASVHFTRTADGIYYNYTYTDNGQNNWPFDVTMTFNRSNTAWTVSPYEPDDTKIGSTNAVGTATNKVYLKFENQTNKDYLLYIDISSTASGSFAFRSIYDLVSQYDALPQTGALISLPLYAFSTFEFFRLSTSSAVYFDAWYLKDLGVSAAYDQGIEDGYDEAYQDGLNNNPNILLSGFQAMVGILINMALMVLNLTVFDVSLLSIFSIMALFVGVIWILKLVRG